MIFYVIDTLNKTKIRRTKMSMQIATLYEIMSNDKSEKAETQMLFFKLKSAFASKRYTKLFLYYSVCLTPGDSSIRMNCRSFAQELKYGLFGGSWLSVIAENQYVIAVYISDSF